MTSVSRCGQSESPIPFIMPHFETQNCSQFVGNQWIRTFHLELEGALSVPGEGTSDGAALILERPIQIRERA